MRPRCDQAAAFDVSWAYVFADDDARARSLLSAGGLGEAAGEREPELRRALIDVLEPFRAADGGYRLENTWHFLIATARSAVYVVTAGER